MNILNWVNYISGITIIIALLVTFISIFFKRKILFSYFRKIPKTLIALNSALFLWGIFFIPKNFSGRGSFGSWQMSKANLSSWSDLISNIRAPLYLWRTKLFSSLFGGINYEFIANMNFIGFFIGVFLIYILVENLTKNKKAAFASSIFYLLNPIIFTFSLTEDYALPALFFMLLSLYFFSIKVDTKDNIFLIPAMSSSLLAAGSRVEYIFFPFLLIIFILAYSNKGKIKRSLLYVSLFVLAIIPRTISALSMYFIDAQDDPALHGKTYELTNNIFSYISKVIVGSSNFFLKNLEEAWSVFTTLENFTLIFLILGIAGVVISIIKNKRIKKATYLFFASFVLLVLYYSYFHAVLGVGAYRYMVTVFTPLLITSGIGLGIILEKRNILYYAFLELLFILTFTTIIFPLTFPEHREFFINDKIRNFAQNQSTRKEYLKYNNLSYENNLSKLLNNQFDVEKGENTYFISNGNRSFIHSMPINGIFYPIIDKNSLDKIIERIEPDDKTYVIQSELGFTSQQIDRYRSVNPKIFKNEIKRFFNIKKKLISYYTEDGHHVFFFEIEPKND